MAKSSSEKLARALRANLKRRKAAAAQPGPQDGSQPKRAPESSPAETSTRQPKSP